MVPTNAFMVTFVVLLSLKMQNEVTKVRLTQRLSQIRRRRKYRLKTYREIKPGRGVPYAGFKQDYRTKRKKERYLEVREDPGWFNSIVHMSFVDFDELHAIVKDEILSPLDPHNSLTAEQRNSMRRKKKKMSSKELLFIFLESMSGGLCGGDVLCSIAGKYGVSPASIWNYIYHTGWAVYRSLSVTEPLTWPSIDERKKMHGLIRGFPGGVMFVDGTRQPIFKSSDEDTQRDQYYGKDKMHCYATLLYVDVYGTIRRVETTYSGHMHDKTLFEKSDVYLNKSKYFSLGENIICDAGFVGSGDSSWLIVPFKKGTGLYFRLREEWNKDLRQRFRNEMSIGYIKNRNRTFMGCWPYSEEFFTICIQVSSMIMNWKLKRNGKQLISIDGMINRMSPAEKLLFLTSQ